MSLFRNTNWCEHNPSSPNERWSHSTGSSIQRKVIILDGSFRGRTQAAYDFLGYQVVVVSPDGIPYIHRVIPMAYPALPGSSFKLAAGEGEVEPAGTVPPDITNRFYVEGISRTEPYAPGMGIDPAALPFGTVASNYPRALMTLECTSLPFNVVDDNTLFNNSGGSDPSSNPAVPDEGVALAKGWQFSRYIVREFEPYTRLIKIPTGIMATDAITNQGKYKIDKVGQAFLEGGEHRRYTWMRVPLDTPGQVPGANFPKIEQAIGGINSEPFDGAPAETLLLSSVSARFYKGAFGEWLGDITFNMNYLPHNSTGARFTTSQEKGFLPPRTPLGTILTAGVPGGWNMVADMDHWGSWDYFAIFAALPEVGGEIGQGNEPYFYVDFSQLFSPAPPIT